MPGAESAVDPAAVSEGDCRFASPSEDGLAYPQEADARAMMLLDTNVLFYASDERSEHCRWARCLIAGGVSGGGASVNAVSIAELCVGDAEPRTVAVRIRSWGVTVLDVPVGAAEIAVVGSRPRARAQTLRFESLYRL
jgi:hypothetical protein